MNFSLLSGKFILIAALSAMLLTIMQGRTRQLVFLALNCAFIWLLVLPPEGFISTMAFCLLGYALVVLHLKRTNLKLIITLPLFVCLFLYMRNYEILHWVLPDSVLTNTLSTIGLSFLLFKIIHVLVDAKGGMIERLDFLTFINYCLNFTTFVMGPIQRYQDYHDQWNGKKLAIDLTYEAHIDAIIRILFGMIKAYILAQLFYAAALKQDTNVLDLSVTEFIFMLYAFFFYLYLNFSGYCDTVIGVGSLLGVRPPENFDLPFIAQNVSDFWQRQHRTLTLWLTDYVFSPTFKNALGSRLLARHDVLAGNAALLLTMFVSGIWHGTTLNFVVFGMAHGLYLVIYHSWDHLLNRLFGKKATRRIRRAWLARLLGIFITFNATSFAFMFFQLDTGHLLTLTHGLFDK